MATENPWAWEWFCDVTEAWIRPKTSQHPTRDAAQGDMYLFKDRSPHRKTRLVEVKPTHEAVQIPMRPKVENLHPDVVSLVTRCGVAMRKRDAKKFDALARECEEVLGRELPVVLS